MPLGLLPVIATGLVIILIVVAAAITFYRHCFSYWKKKGVNCLDPVIPFGNAADFFLGIKGFGELFKDWYLEMKIRNWSFGGAYFCGKPVFIPVDNELVKRIMISEFLTFPNHGLYIDDKDPLSGHIFNMENYKWKNLRAKFPTAFTAVKTRSNVIVMERISRQLIDVLDKRSRANKSVNIKEVLTRFTTDVITACAFGMDSKTLNNQNEELIKQQKPFFDHQWSRTSNVLVILIPRYILSLFGFKLFPAKTARYFMDMFRKIKEHRETQSVKRNDLADLLIDLCDETKDHPNFDGQGKMEPLTFNEFAAQMYVFFEAGFETSSSTQTFALYELAANTEIQDRLRKEINTVLGKYNGLVGYDAVNEMEYLDRIIDETLRKYPIFPILPRACSKDYQIPNTNITLEKNTFVMISNFGIHYNPDYYPDPMKFDPERFTSENKAKRPHCSYLPFGEGPRICVGKRFGIWQTKIGILSIIRNFKLSVSKKMQLPLRFDRRGLILRAEGDVWLDLQRITQVEDNA